MDKRERKISRFIGRWITEQGAGTVEYVIVVLVAIVIGDAEKPLLPLYQLQRKLLGWGSK